MGCRSTSGGSRLGLPEENFLLLIEALGAAPAVALPRPRLTVAGVGLIGGSLALAARKAGLVGEVVGFGCSEANLQLARERGIVDRFARAATAVAGAASSTASAPATAVAGSRANRSTIPRSRATRRFSSLRPKPDHLPDQSRLSCRQRERAADESHPGDREAVEERGHRRAAERCLERLDEAPFSSGKPIVTRRYSGKP